MTRNSGRLSLGPSDPVGHRQKIESIEYTISTTMPGQIGLGALKQFEGDILAAIEFLRRAKGQCKNKAAVISALEAAKIPLQLAIDEASPRGNNKRRYISIADVGKNLKKALNNW